MTTASGNEKKALWTVRYERNRDGYPELLAADPFESWEQSHMPQMRVGEELAMGLYVAYALGPENEQAVAFFRRACQVAQRAIDEDKLTSLLSESSFPLNRGSLYRDYAYARALLGERLDVAALEQSSRDFEEWCKGYARGEWDSQAQANYLSAVRLALIGGDLDRARELLKTKKSFKWHNTEHALWKMLVEKGASVREDAEVVALYDYYFTKLRDPGFVPDVYMETDVVRLELAALRDKCLVSENGEIDWHRTVASVAA